MASVVLGRMRVLEDLVAGGVGESVANWIDAIAEAAAVRWAQGKPLFLAQIPPEMHRRRIDLDAVLAGRTLREAIGVDAADRVRLVRDPMRALVWGVLPKSVSEETDLRPLFEKSPKTISTTSSQPRYKRPFFTAFVKSIEADHRRWITPGGFVDLPEENSPPPDAVAFEPGDSLNLVLGTPIDIEAVHAAIGKWAQRNGINLERFYAGSSHATVESKPRDEKTLNLASLDQDDLKRIMVPMDVVMKLLRR